MLKLLKYPLMDIFWSWKGWKGISTPPCIVGEMGAMTSQSVILCLRYYYLTMINFMYVGRPGSRWLFAIIGYRRYARDRELCPGPGRGLKSARLLARLPGDFQLLVQAWSRGKYFLSPARVPGQYYLVPACPSRPGIRESQIWSSIN